MQEEEELPDYANDSSPYCMFSRKYFCIIGCDRKGKRKRRRNQSPTGQYTWIIQTITFRQLPTVLIISFKKIFLENLIQN